MKKTCFQKQFLLDGMGGSGRGKWGGGVQEGLGGGGLREGSLGWGVQVGGLGVQWGGDNLPLAPLAIPLTILSP